MRGGEKGRERGAEELGRGRETNIMEKMHGRERTVEE